MYLALITLRSSPQSTNAWHTFRFPIAITLLQSTCTIVQERLHGLNGNQFKWQFVAGQPKPSKHDIKTCIHYSPCFSQSQLSWSFNPRSPHFVQLEKPKCATGCHYWAMVRFSTTTCTCISGASAARRTSRIANRSGKRLDVLSYLRGWKSCLGG